MNPSTLVAERSRSTLRDHYTYPKLLVEYIPQRNINLKLTIMKKLTLIFSVLLIGLISCQNNQTKEELEKYRAQTVLEEQNQAIVIRVFDGLNQQDETVYQELYAANYSWYLPSNNSEKITREEEIVFMKLLWSSFPDIQWKIEEMIAKGSKVIVRFTVSGTFKEEYQGIPPTNDTFGSGGVWIASIEDGKLVEAREDVDQLGWMLQLGMEVKPKDEGN